MPTTSRQELARRYKPIQKGWDFQEDVLDIPVYTCLSFHHIYLYIRTKSRPQSKYYYTIIIDLC